MMATDNSSYFETIEEQIKTSSIVTFKWLSRTLKIHNTVAKKVLQDFVSAKKSDYVVTLAVYGKKSNGDLLLSLVKESDLESLRSDVDVLDQHIYSVQPSDSTFDPNLVYNIDKATYELKQLSLSSIKYNKEIIRKVRAVPVASAGAHSKKTEKVSVLRVKKDSDSVKPQKSENSTSKTENDKKNDASDTKTGSPPAKKGSASKPQTNNGKGNISSFFQKQLAKSTNKAENTPKETVEKSPVSNEDANVNEKLLNSETPRNNELKLKPGKKVEKSENKEKENSKEKPVTARKSNDKGSSANASKAKKSKKEKPRRKRIVMMSDSSSEGEASEEDDHLSEPEPMPEFEPESPKKIEPEAATVVVHGKKRKRKVIDETVMDDEGYVHTTKKEVYESCESDSEEPEQNNENVDSNKRLKLDEPQQKAKPVENNTKTNKKEEASKNGKKKQSSIMSFFKKPQKT